MNDPQPRIRILPDSLVDVIAAGEVVERPASVVKELVENALDAGASDIRVKISDGGRRLVRVSDDGSGMDEENALLAIERHATSKISDIEDLRHIRTLGFRGEAIPSIAAVGRFTMETWDGRSDSGTKVIMESGRLLSVEPCGRAKGTTVSLEGIFRRLPARRKFLRTRETETAWCGSALEDAALANPPVSFALVSDGAQMLALPPSASLRDRVAALWGVDTTKNLISLSHKGAEVTLEGLISSPVVTYSRRTRHRIMVNGRPVRDPVLNRVISSALAGSWPAGRFPALVLSLIVEDDHVDVNVHPAKREVRFRRPETLADALREAVRGVKAPVKISIPYAGSGNSPDRTADQAAEVKLPFGSTKGQPRESRALSPADHPTETPHQAEDHWRIIGQVLGTYILLEDENGLVIIDQHAAHERIVFNRLMSRRAGENVPVQHLAVPLILTLSPSETASLLAYRDLLNSFGFMINQFGPDTVRVTAVPSDLKAAQVEDLLRQVTGGPERLSREPESVALAVSRWACRESVMAGQKLSKVEMDRLVRELDGAESGFSCPHGRPTRISLDPAELEKLFGRR
jgi:DNA mismatch repair protein MutL